MSGVSTASADTSSGPPSNTTSADSTGEAPKFDIGVGPDVGTTGEDCPDDAFNANDNNLCAAAPVVYDREAGVLTLSITGGVPYQLTDPSVEVIFTTDQPGYEGFFTIAREMSEPDVYYMTIADDDFIEVSYQGECGTVDTQGETDCVPGVGGDICRAFVDDFIPIVAGAYVGTPFQVDTFGRRQSPDGSCCADYLECNASVGTFTEYVVTGPSGTMHFAFEDGFAFLDTMGWSYIPGQFVSGDAMFEFDLCSLPVPAG